MRKPFAALAFLLVAPAPRRSPSAAVSATLLLCLAAFPAAAIESPDSIRVLGPSGFVYVEPDQAKPAARPARSGRGRVDPAIHAKVTQHAMRHGVPADIAHRVIRHESGYKPRVRGQAGEYGLGQIKCATARGEGFTGPCAALFDPDTNLEFSMRYLRKALARGGVQYYNAGIHAKRVPKMAMLYAAIVMGGRR